VQHGGTGPDNSPETNGGWDSEESRVSPLSAAMVVKNPAGVYVRLDSDLQPHPEHRSIDLINNQDGSAVLCARVSETATGSSLISVETKAKGIAIAVMDTRNTVFPEGESPLPPHERCVVIHRVTGGGSGEIGIPCAKISARRGIFLVHYLVGGEPGLALTVHAS